MYIFCSMIAVILSFASQDNTSEIRRQPEEHRQQAITLNDLAGRIATETDALDLVNKAAEMFSKELPPAWVTAGIREQIARAEFMSAIDPASLIPDERIAKVWNEYVREIHAPDETMVTAAEIHALRDAQYASDRYLWDRNFTQSIWTIPNAVALGPDGKVAHGARVLETLRLLASMNLIFDNVRSARKLVQEGRVASDEMAKRASDPVTKPTFRTELRAGMNTNPLWTAERRYVQEHGEARFHVMMAELLDKLLGK